MEENKIKVYIKVDENIITQIESEISSQYFDFKDTSIWVLIDEGIGDKYSHAQGNYFPKNKPLRDMQGRCNYKYVDCKVIELTEEEKEKLYLPTPPQPNEQQVLNAKLLQDNAEMSIELEKQKQLNAQILLQLAGGNANV
ncbi:hypothetical protein [Clostridium botulinum]|uniref:hypothetical protein n=1 Tax=Clostridium botulinum TaxID=1491 RepID=UPI0009B1EB60|nr:hypothetical protein [Clostridium botulinum]MBY6934518.1 hypothetical protein [Clostridium botulinum]